MTILLILPRLLTEAVLDVAYFPLWWYSRGTGHAAKYCCHLLKNGNQSLAPGLWLKNIFVPMYGQYDLEGQIISFFMRLFQVIIRTLALLIWLVFCLILFFLWLVFPLLIVYGLISPFRQF